MKGLNVEVIEGFDDSHFGQVMCHGEIWRAKSEGDSFSKGQRGIVKSVEGMTLIIRSAS